VDLSELSYTGAWMRCGHFRVPHNLHYLFILHSDAKQLPTAKTKDRLRRLWETARAVSISLQHQIATEAIE
jgi:hypothetical protein